MPLLCTDLRFCARSLSRAPGFALVAVLALSLGIGGVTAMFTLVNGVLLKPLAYRDPGRLVLVSEVVRELAHLAPALPVNARHFDAWKLRCAALEDAALLEARALNLTGAGEPERLDGAGATASLFDTLGARPALGRTFTADEEQAGKARVVVLSHGLWQRRFGGDRGILGRTVTLDGAAYEVIGVMPPEFRMPRPAAAKLVNLPDRIDFYRPLVLDRSQIRLIGEFNYMVLARLRPGVSLPQARDQLNAIQADLARQGEEKVTLTAALEPLQDAVAGASRRPLWLLLGAVGAVLLVVCVNLANLLLVRGAARAREIAIRLALGAGRARLVWLALLESLLLALPAGLLGLVLAWAAVRAVAAGAGVSLPRAQELSLDWQAASAGLLLSLLTALAFGALPALRLTAADPQNALKAGSHTVTDTRSSVRLRGVLVAAQTGLSAALLVFAGLLAASLFRLTGVEKGYRVERILTSEIVLPASTYAGKPARDQFYRRLLDSIRRTPGVESAAITSHAMLGGESWVNPLWTAGDARRMVERPMANLRFISPAYFATLGTPLLAGRTFAESGRGRNVVVLSRRAAEAVWPGVNPLGRRIYTFTSDGETPLEVVGVVGDTRSTSLEGEPPLMAFFPYWQQSRNTAHLMIRTARDPLSLAAAVRAVVRAIDSSVPVARTRPLSGVLDEATARQRFQARLAAGFAAFALLLASLGVYGVAAYWAARRRPEIGIRLALGASREQVARLVALQGAVPAAGGLALGLAAAWAGGRLVQSLLFGVSAAEPWVYASVAFLLGICFALALLIPAWRASRTRAAAALRYE